MNIASLFTWVWDFISDTERIPSILFQPERERERERENVTRGRRQ
jgi:hypothetical protein